MKQEVELELNVPWQASVQSRQGKRTCVPAGRQSGGVMKIMGGLRLQSKNVSLIATDLNMVKAVIVKHPYTVFRVEYKRQTVLPLSFKETYIGQLVQLLNKSHL